MILTSATETQSTLLPLVIIIVIIFQGSKTKRKDEPYLAQRKNPILVHILSCRRNGYNKREAAEMTHQIFPRNNSQISTSPFPPPPPRNTHVEDSRNADSL